MSSGSSPQLLTHLEWASDKLAGVEHVTLQNFVNHFDLSDRLSATSLYQRLVACKEIRKCRREKLQESFNLFRKHEETRFWAKRAVTVSSEVVANRALVTVQEFGQAQSQSVLDQYALEAPNFLANSSREERIEGSYHYVDYPQVSVHSPDIITAAFGQNLSSFDHEDVSQPRTPTINESSHPLQPSSTPTILKRGRLSRALPRKTARFTTSKARIKEPWHSLMETALALHNGQEVDLLELDMQDEDMTLNRSKLYQLALQNMYNAKALQMQQHFDRAHCLDFKDAFVCLSGIWNTYSITANNLFGAAATAEAKAFCYMQSMDEKDDALMEIVGTLLEKKTLEEALDETYLLQVAQPTHRRILDVVRIIIRNIIRPLHGSKKESSEADCVAVWSSIIQEGLPLDSLFSMNLGEQGCSASALSKSKLANVFETGTLARKCDALLSVSGVEVGNFEFKRAGASKPEVVCQLRKNIKINKSILLELDKYGLECPLLLSIHGMSAIVFRVRKWHDIWVAGKASRTIVLPSTFEEFRLFLGNQVHQLARLLSHYHEYATQADKLFQQYQYRKKGEDEEDIVSPAPKSITETLDWEQVVFHTPTKPSKRASLLDRF